MKTPATSRWIAWCAARCLRLFPALWRARYQEEMLELLHQHPLTLWTIADLCVSALDAHLHRQLLPKEVFTMIQRIRTNIGALFVATTLLFIAWVMVPFIQDSPVEWTANTQNHPEIRLILGAFQTSGAIAVLVLLIVALPLWGVMARQALQQRRSDILLRLLTPVVLAGVLVAYSRVAQPHWWQRFARAQLAPQPSDWVKLSFFALAFVCFGVSVWAFTSALRRSEISERGLRLLRIPSLLLAATIGICTVALVALTVVIFVEAPQLAAPFYLMPSFDVVLGLACCIAGAAAWRMLAPGQFEATA
jgi:hypothetical protein